MEIVQPIRDKNKIKEMKEELLKSSERDYLLFLTGINSGLRISDILNLKVSDVKDKTHIHIKEKKTGKDKRFFINKPLSEAFKQYAMSMDNDNYLFASRKGENKPITRVQAYRILNKAAKVVGLEEIGTHTLRKTFGYWYYKQFKDVAILQDVFNHSSPSITLRYIGINDDVKDKNMNNFEL